VLASVFNVAIALRLFLGVFFAPPLDPSLMGEGQSHVHDPTFSMLLGPVILGVVSLLLGVWPALTNPLIAQAASAVLAETVKVKLAVWHGITTPLILSVTAIALGFGLYLVYGWASMLVERLLRVSFNSVYDGALAGLNKFARIVIRVLQNGALRYYLMTILVASTLLVGYALLAYGWEKVDWLNIKLNAVRPSELLLSGVIIVMAIAVTRVQRRLAAIAGMGVIGALVSLFFVLFSAPDLALTQLVIETLMVIVFLLVFHFLPRFFNEYTSRLARARDLLISVMVGLAAAGLVLFATGTHFAEGSGIAKYFKDNSYVLAHGHNVVNVILVDFRGFDTLGEISVLTIAATGIYALLKGRLDKSES